MLKYTPQTLQKVEHVFSALTYSVRYEKGNFQSGYCILESQKTVVVNKFLNIEGKINALIDILIPILQTSPLSDLPSDVLKMIRFLKLNLRADGTQDDLFQNVQEDAAVEMV